MSEHFKLEKVPTILTVHQGSVLDVHEGSMDDASLTELLSKVSNSATAYAPSGVVQSGAQSQGQQHACSQ